MRRWLLAGVTLFLMLGASCLIVDRGSAQIPGAMLTFTPPTTGPCGATPAPAALAGFTTCAAFFDFGAATGASWLPTPFSGPPSTLSNWLDLVGNVNSGVPFHSGQGTTAPPIPLVAGTNISVAYDSAAGKNVLIEHWLKSYSSYGCSLSPCAVSISGQTYDRQHALDFPNAVYIEAVTRTGPGYASSGQQDDNNFWMWCSGDNAGHNNDSKCLEYDAAELQMSSGGYGVDGLINWAGGGGGGFTWTSYSSPLNTRLPPGWSQSAYHKYGLLATSDGVTSVYVCEWIDDVFQSCVHASPTNPAAYSIRHFLLAASNGRPATGDSYPTQDVFNYVQYMGVWACGGWASGQCNGSSLYNSGGGNPLIYWH